ncbi:selenium-dependent molybdenum cofactor biosynthesis protein YqeB [Synergistes jonesii]|uniref:Molybdenum hydroxylase n=1 Tax=Synergistes jonesii TaxID=2754 RepID=A0A073IQN2_9BACT|nr:selenium-dependent molybdenum cofactor biosynthesis protein YqeB [Synergistes jonesii]KEJ92024.1 hypothetical protein EH55_06480 [Synergistes jonesii]
MTVLIRGAGDLASGIAARLKNCGFGVIMTDLSNPTSIRRAVSFSEAIVHGETVVEGITARFAGSVREAMAELKRGYIAVLADSECGCLDELCPEVLVDAIMAKRNTGTKITDAPIVIGVGPGFAAGLDCGAVVETMRGHAMGRAIYKGCATPNTNIPGLIGGFAGERVLRAPYDGIFHATAEIGDYVKAGDIVGYVECHPMCCTISGVLRGLIADGTPVRIGMKSGDVDPRGKVEYCRKISDKALAVAGGVLEAIFHIRMLNRNGSVRPEIIPADCIRA